MFLQTIPTTEWSYAETERSRSIFVTWFRTALLIIVYEPLPT